MQPKEEKSHLEVLKERKELEKSIAHKLASLILLEYPRDLSPDTAVIKIESVEDTLGSFEDLLTLQRSSRLVKKKVKIYVLYFDDKKVELFSKLDMDIIYAPFLLENKCGPHFDFFNLRKLKDIIETFDNIER